MPNHETNSCRRTRNRPPGRRDPRGVRCGLGLEDTEAQDPEHQVDLPEHGTLAGGTTVQILGKNLGGTLSVDFGSVPATTVTTVNQSQVLAVSPPGAELGSVDVTVTTTVGTTATEPADQFSYV